MLTDPDSQGLFAQTELAGDMGDCPVRRLRIGLSMNDEFDGASLEFVGVFHWQERISFFQSPCLYYPRGYSIRLAGEGLDRCRQRVQQHTLGHRGRAGDPLYRARRTLQTGADLLTDTQRARLDTVFAADEHVQVEATWGIYQRMVAAYREPNKTTGKQRMRAVIESVASGVPDALVEIRTLGRTLKQRAADVLAFFDRPGTSNGPTEAINGRLEHLRGSALGFRNLTHYIARSLLEAGGFRPRLHPQLR